MRGSVIVIDQSMNNYEISFKSSYHKWRECSVDGERAGPRAVYNGSTNLSGKQS